MCKNMERTDEESNSSLKGRTQREEVSDTRKKKTWTQDTLKLCPAK